MESVQINTLNPKISVLLPVFNGGRFLKESIESILTQTYTDFEILIIDDGSKDNSLDIINNFNDKSFFNINSLIYWYFL